MNTPAHALLAVAALARGERRPFTPHAIAGALLPDLPMFGFFFWQNYYVGLSQSQIWDDAYFQPNWQLFFDTFNSAPLALLGLAIATFAQPAVRRGAQVFFGSVLIHIFTDLPLHHDDGHRHFLPISRWRFESPVSYWDPRHAGALGAGLEVICVVGASVVLWRRFPQWWIRGLVVLLSGLSTFAYTHLYVFGGITAFSSP